MKADLLLLFFLMLLLLAVVYYVGFVSDTLVFTKAVQQVGYYLSGRTSSGQFANAG